MSDNDDLPFAAMRTHGLLWLINRAVFHPRGYALAFQVADDGETVTGWTMLGDGTESWNYADSVDEDESFRAVEAFLASLRNEQLLDTLDTPSTSNDTQ